VTLCSDVVGYQCFGGPCCLHLRFTLNREDRNMNLHHGGNLDVSHLGFLFVCFFYLFRKVD